MTLPLITPEMIDAGVHQFRQCAHRIQEATGVVVGDYGTAETVRAIYLAMERKRRDQEQQTRNTRIAARP